MRMDTATYLLVAAAGLTAGVIVFVKVRLMDVVSVADDAWPKYGAPGSGMHLDLC
jgi:hypothetical protein